MRFPLVASLLYVAAADGRDRRELAATYSLPLSPSASAFVYVGLPGEPALGPPAFMHRASALDNPVPPSATTAGLDPHHLRRRDPRDRRPAP